MGSISKPLFEIFLIMEAARMLDFTHLPRHLTFRCPLLGLCFQCPSHKWYPSTQGVPRLLWQSLLQEAPCFAWESTGSATRAACCSH